MTPPAVTAVTAVTAVQPGLPERVAATVVEFMTGPLAQNPRRAGKELRRDLVGIMSARWGTYPMPYRIAEETMKIVVLPIDRRRDVYR